MNALIVLNALLRGDADVAALMGDRLWPDILPPQPELPAIAYAENNVEREQSAYAPSGAVATTVQLSIFAKRRIDVEKLAAACIKAVERQSGVIDGVTLDDVFITGSQALIDDGYTGATGLPYKTLDVELHTLE